MEQRVEPRLLADRYRCEELLGRGGMAEVHAGTDLRLQRPVAIKTLRPAMAARTDVRTRFEIEARSAASLSHPHAVAVFDTGEHDGVPFIVMERLPGETLADRMAEGPVDADWLCRIALDVLDALGEAHARGLVHRDIKPGNILLTEDGRAKVADFGIAKSLDRSAGEPDLTGTGLLVGTPAYLAPERLDGEPASVRADIYSLGVVLYEALAGRKPFLGDTPLAVAYSVQHVDPPPLAEIRPGLDPALVTAVERAMERDPKVRFATAAEMAAVLVSPPATEAPAAAAAAAATTVVEAGEGVDHTAVLTTPPAPLQAPVAPAPPLADRPIPTASGRPRRRRVPFAAVVLAVALLAGLIAALGGEEGRQDVAQADDPSRQALVDEMRYVADRVEVGDGPKGPEAAERLRGIAGDYAAGDDVADDATGLIEDAREWNDEGDLYNTATALVVSTLARVPGVTVPEAAAEQPAQPSTQTPTVEGDDGEGAGGGNGNGKGKGNDKD